MQEDHEDVAATAVSIVVEHKPNQQLHIAVSALVPRKRTGADDAVTSKLVHYLFWDDTRYCTHLDALLTRLAPLSVVHLASTERAQLPSSSKNPSAAVVRRVKQVAALLDKLDQVVSSRTDLSTCNHDDNLVHVHHTLPKQNDLQDVLQHVLDESSHLAFRGVVLEEIIQKSLSLVLRGQGIHHTAAAHSISLEQGVLSSHLVLDRTASEAIHLLPPATAAGTAPLPSSCSLFGIFNRCRTTMGSRNLKAWLRQPLVDLNEIQKRQDAVTFLLTNVDRIRDEGLQGWPDVDALAARLEGYREEVTGPTSRALSCLYKLYLLTIQQVPVLYEALYDVLGEDNSTTGLLLRECQEGFLSVREELSGSQQLVEAVLDLQEAPRNYYVKASFSDEMLQIKQELDGLDAEFDACLEEMNQAWCNVSGNENVKLESFESGDYQFRLANTNDSKLLQGAHFQKGITVHKLLKNGVYFSTKELRQLVTKKRYLVHEYDKHQREIVVNAMKVAATYAPLVEKASALVAQLDCLCSLANVAAYSPNTYCRPILTDGEDDGLGTKLKGARHPCVELQDSMEYIPNDISLIFGESSFLMVTGPNMGGKSTYICALGAIVTLAPVGAHVPCTSAKINIVHHHILARVGAGDVQDRGISTFMAEMLEASSILKTATKCSLIVIDELGRGTSTFDGYGLATAISEYIIQKLGCMTVFATHFHELTALEERCAMAKNCHVTATTAGKNGLTFMYEVRPGPCLESFGMQVAEMAHVPPVLLADAKRRAKHLENFDYRKKKKKVDEQFLKRFCQIPMDSLSGEEKKRAPPSVVAVNVSF